MKSIYKENASLIPGWRKLGRSELCRRYLQYKDVNQQLAQSYLSAIIYNFWNVIQHDYYSQQVKMASETDCYEWVIDSILYCLNKHVWTDPDSQLYKDPNGPEKAINVSIVSGRANYYVARNRDKRKVQLESISLDKLQEDSSDSYFLPYFDTDDTCLYYLYDKVRDYFTKKDYFASFAIHAIITFDFQIQYSEDGNMYTVFSDTQLKHYLRNMSDDDYNYFSEMYDINLCDVKYAAKYVKDLTYDRMSRNLNNLFNTLKHDRQFLKTLKGY